MNELIDLNDELEIERYELRERPGHLTSSENPWDSGNLAGKVSRRELMSILGAGILVYCLASDAGAQESGRGRRGGFGGGQGPREISAWLHIGEDGKVTVFTGKAEVGQNAR